MKVTLKFHYVMGGEERTQTVTCTEATMDRVIGEVNDRLKACGAHDVWHEELDEE